MNYALYEGNTLYRWRRYIQDSQSKMSFLSTSGKLFHRLWIYFGGIQKLLYLMSTDENSGRNRTADEQYQGSRKQCYGFLREGKLFGEMKFWCIHFRICRENICLNIFTMHSMIRNPLPIAGDVGSILNGKILKWKLFLPEIHGWENLETASHKSTEGIWTDLETKTAIHFFIIILSNGYRQQYYCIFDDCFDKRSDFRKEKTISCSLLIIDC